MNTDIILWIIFPGENGLYGSDAIRIIPDYTLSKFACKLVCMNGDPVQKPIVAMAQVYFYEIAINNYEDMIDKYYYDAKIDVIIDQEKQGK